MSILPESLASTIRSVFGANGEQWLANFPKLLHECAERYSLEILPPFPNLSFNYVTPVRRTDGTEAVLKLGVPHPELSSEIVGLRVYDGRKAARLFESDTEKGVLLMERIMPGTPLTTLADDEHDDEATLIAANVMRDLWRPVLSKEGLQTVVGWSEGFAEMRKRFDGGTSALPVNLVEKAERIYAEYLQYPTGQVLLHGDLHHDNILQNQNGEWLAIDPKGIVGESEYEVFPMVRNLWEDRHTRTDPKRIMERRLDIFAEVLGFDKERMRNWCIAQSMLSAWWCLGDNMDCWQGDVAMAEMLNN